MRNFQICIGVPLESTVTKKVIVFLSLDEESSFCNISNFHVFLFKIHQKFKGHFLNELRVAFNNTFGVMSAWNYDTNPVCIIVRWCLRRKKGMTLKLCQLIEYYIWNIFMKNAESVHKKLIPDPFFNFGR